MFGLSGWGGTGIATAVLEAVGVAPPVPSVPDALERWQPRVATTTTTESVTIRSKESGVERSAGLRFDLPIA